MTVRAAKTAWYIYKCHGCDTSFEVEGKAAEPPLHPECGYCGCQETHLLYVADENTPPGGCCPPGTGCCGTPGTR